MATVTGSFTASANIYAGKASIVSTSAATRIVHKFNSGKNDGSDTSVVRPTDWDAEHIIIGSLNSTTTIGVKALWASGALAATGAYTPIAFNGTNEYDTDGFHSPVTNNSRITIPASLGGFYLLIGNYYTNSAVQAYGTFRVNGGGWASDYGVTGKDGILTSVSVKSLNGGDYVEFGVNSSTTTISSAWFIAIKLDSGRLGSGVGASYIATSNQNNTGSDIALNLDTKDFDTDGFWAAGSPTKFTIPPGMGGLYVVLGEARFAAVNTTGVRQVYFKINGTTLRQSTMVGAFNQPQDLQVETIVKLNAGDYIELWAGQNSGATVAIGSGGNNYASTRLSIMRLDSIPQAYQDNMAASGAPTASNDSSQGYSIGSRWTDTTNAQEYFCIDATAGAAVWRKLPTRTAYRDVAVSNGATVTIGDDTTIARVGAALIFNMDGNDGGCFIQYYRSGTFNTVVGTSLGGSLFEFRGTTFSAGSGNFSIFLASNSAGAALQVKNNAGFGRTMRIFEFATTGNLT